MNKPRHILLLLLILALSFSAGCWDQEEIENLAVIRGIGIDYLPGRRAPYLVTLAVKRPAGAAGEEGGGGGEPTVIYSGVGASVDLAIQQASMSLSKTVFLSHAELYIVGEEAAKSGLSPILDFIIRHPQTRLNGYIMVMDGLAQDALKLSERMEDSVSEEILSLISTSQQTSETHPQQAFMFLRNMATPGHDPFTGVIRIRPPLSEMIPESGTAQEETGESEAGQEEEGGGGGGQEEDIHALEGIAVFRGDKLAGILTYPETRGVLWLMGEMRRSVMAVNDPVHPQHNVSLSTARSSTTITAIVENDNISFRVEVETEGDILAQTSLADIASPDTLEKINSAMAGVIKEEIESSLQLLQDLESDVVGFGSLLNRSHPEAYRKVAGRWPEVFRDMKVEVHVEANIRRTGQHSSTTRINR